MTTSRPDNVSVEDYRTYRTTDGDGYLIPHNSMRSSSVEDYGTRVYGLKSVENAFTGMDDDGYHIPCIVQDISQKACSASIDSLARIRSNTSSISSLDSSLDSWDSRVIESVIVDENTFTEDYSTRIGGRSDLRNRAQSPQEALINNGPRRIGSSIPYYISFILCLFFMLSCVSCECSCLEKGRMAICGTLDNPANLRFVCKDIVILHTASMFNCKFNVTFDLPKLEKIKILKDAPCNCFCAKYEMDNCSSCQIPILIPTTTPHPHPHPPSTANSTSAVLGGVVGGGAFFSLSIAGLIYCRCRYQRRYINRDIEMQYICDYELNDEYIDDIVYGNIVMGGE